MDTCSKLGLIDRRRRLYEEQQQSARKKENTSVSFLPILSHKKLLSDTNVKNIVASDNNHYSSISEQQRVSDNKSTTTNQQTMEYSDDKEDVCYHHFALIYNDQELIEKLLDVQFVLIAGSTSRVEAHAKYLEQRDLFKNNNWELERITDIHSSRFNLFKVGPVLLANHGIGSASMSVAVFELLLMCRAADRLDKITLIRFGTCGGIGVDPGTVCITNKVYDALFRSFVDWPVCGEIVRRQSIIDSETYNALIEIGEMLESKDSNFKCLGGGTMSTDDFYEEQGRTNGPICDHSLDDKMRFLERVQGMGIINMEMEANVLASICCKLNVRHGIVCVALTDRLVQDKITVAHDVISCDYEVRLFKLNAAYIELTLTGELES